MQFFYFAILLLSSLNVFGSQSILSEANMSGQTGLVFMPNARLEDDGVLRFGASNADPYFTLWGSATLLPRLEMSGRFTTIRGLPAFGGAADYRDKAFDAKLLLWRETAYVPSVTVGIQDFLGTRLFDAKFVALNKKFFNLDVTMGYGQGRIDGGWAGVRYKPSWGKKFGFVVEYDANDYQQDIGARRPSVYTREGGVTYAVEYRDEWFGGQLAFQDGEAAVNAFVSIPLMKKEFVPKIDEPAPFTGRRSPPSSSSYEGHASQPALRSLLQALHFQGFKDIRFSLAGNSFEAHLTHSRISQSGRVVGRAARTVLLLGPPSIESIKITYTDNVNGLPILTYHFRDANVLQEYFDGLLSLGQLNAYIDVEYTPSQRAKELGMHGISASSLDAAPDGYQSPSYADEGHIVSFKEEDPFLSSFQFIPFNLRLFFNDPSGAYRYDTFSLVNYKKRIRNHLFFSTSAKLMLLEDVSGVSQISNSLLPHVRSDVAEYRKGDRGRLDTLLLNQYFHPQRRFYGRLSIGYYEEMFAGAGGQLLYLPKNSRWAFDLAADWLKQREFQGGLDFKDYTTVSALGSVHYRSPVLGLSVTARAGRFLAKDTGIRLEVSRQFRSGVVVGAWYTHTDANDITGPGRPGAPYQDKGVFASVPLNSMLTWDSRATARLSIAPWTRDVGQMVASPGDLYLMMDRSSVWKGGEFNPLAGLEK